jgi:uncharacterized protein (DUF924 family)
MNDSFVETILDFWFGTDSMTATDEERVARRWFVRDDAFDAEIRRRFGALIDPAVAGELDTWSVNPRGRLALLLVLDQFPRNLYRDSPEAFAGDRLAQRLALDGIARGHDLALATRYRAFCYLPLEHSEDLTLQQRCVALFTTLATDTSAVPADRYAMYLDYARRHLDVIARFGRFPHRNHVLGRMTRLEEQIYLDAGGGF